MSFDAGAIEATASVNRAQFQADLAAMLAQYKAWKAAVEADAPKVRTSLGIGTAIASQGIGNLAGMDLTKLSLLGTDPLLLKKLEQDAAAPGGIGILGIGTDANLQRLLRQALQNAANQSTPLGVLGLGSGQSAADMQKVYQKLIGPSPTAGAVVQPVEQKVIGTEGGDQGVPWVIPALVKVINPDVTAQVNVDMNDEAALAGIAELRAALATLLATTKTVYINANDTAALATLASFQAKLAALSGLAAGASDTNTFGQLAADLFALHGDADQAASGMDDLATGTSNAVKYAETLSAQLKNLLPVSLAFGTAGLLGWVHLAIDGFIELAAIVVPSTVAILAYGAALSALAPTVDVIYQRELNMYTAFDQLGQKLPGLNDSLNKLNAEFKPQVIEVWGDALTVANSNSGLLVSLLKTATSWVDQFAARMVVDFQDGGSALKNLIDAGSKDLALLGTIGATLGNILLNFVKVTEITHVAQDLLGVIEVLAEAVDEVSKLPAPLLAVVVGLHALYLWGGLAVGILFRIGTAIPGINQLANALDSMAASALESQRGIPFVVSGLVGIGKEADGSAVKIGVLQTSLALLQQVPVWGWVAIGAAVLATILIELHQTSDATIQWANALETAVQKANQFAVFNQLLGDMQQLKATTLSLQAQTDQYVGSLTAFQKASGEAKDSAKALQLESDQEVTQATWLKMLGQITDFGTGVEYIMKTFSVTYPEALAIAQQAGVNLTQNMQGNSKAAQDMRQQIIGLVSGFAQLQTPAGVAGDDFEVLAYNANDITQKIQSLNSAWDAWLGSVTGSETQFVTFAQGMATLATDADAAGASMGGLNTNSLALQAQFQAQVTQLNTYLDALRTAYGTGDVSSQQLNSMTTAVKAGVAALIPYAEGNKTAAAELYALAQEANYTGSDSLSALAAWTGVKTPGALKVMQKSTEDATVAASNLATTIQSLLNVQFEDDVISASGASKALDKYTTSLINNGANSEATESARAKLISDLEKAGLSAQQATTYVDGLARSLPGLDKTVTTTLDLKGDGTISLRADGAYIQGAQGHIVAYAGGTAGASPGWALVGEEGPELVKMSGGEPVIPNSKLNGYASGTPSADEAWMADMAKSMSGEFDVGVANTFSNAVAKSIAQALDAAIQPGSAGPGGGGVLANMALAMQLMPAWSKGSMWAAWDALWMRESGWNQFARNPSSGAYGIPQALPPSKMGAAANPPDSNVHAQETWGINYIEGRYGNPENAWAHEVAYGWYANGLNALVNSPTLIGVGEHGPEHVSITPFGGGHPGTMYNAAGNPLPVPGITDTLNVLKRISNQLDTLNKTTHTSAARTGQALGDALGRASHAAVNRALY
jgi:hypothetical protein